MKLTFVYVNADSVKINETNVRIDTYLVTVQVLYLVCFDFAILLSFREIQIHTFITQPIDNGKLWIYVSDLIEIPKENNFDYYFFN